MRAYKQAEHNPFRLKISLAIEGAATQRGQVPVNSSQLITIVMRKMQWADLQRQAKTDWPNF